MVLMKPHPDDVPANRADWRKRIFIVIFGSDTRAGKLFDVVLLWSILFNISCVALESVQGIRLGYGEQLRALEWFFTGLFTLEYVLRLVSAPNPARYARSFLGLLDFFSIIPTYLSLYYGGTEVFVVIRAIRLLRIFRIFKLAQYSGEADILLSALKASRQKITVFIGGMLTLIVIMGAAMYVIEGRESGFSSIPTSMYWSIVTLTTVGYGDITPLTPLGKIMASIIMLMGYGILAVPTGIVSVELGRAHSSARSHQTCPRCGSEKHLSGSRYCAQCGKRLLAATQAANRSTP